MKSFSCLLKFSLPCTHISSSVFPFAIKKLQVSQGRSLQRNSEAIFSMSLVFSFIVTEKNPHHRLQPLLSLKLQGIFWSESQPILHGQTNTSKYELNDVSEPPSFGRGYYTMHWITHNGSIPACMYKLSRRWSPLLWQEALRHYSEKEWVFPCH